MIWTRTRPPLPVCVVPSGTWRPNAIAAALQKGAQVSSKEAEVLDEADDVAASLGRMVEAAGADPQGDTLSMLDAPRRVHPIQPGMWLGLMEEHFGWVFADVDEDAEEDGKQVAVGIGGQRVPVIKSAVACIPGDLSDGQVARLRADIGAAHPAGAVLLFDWPTGWLPERGGDGLVCMAICCGGMARGPTSCCDRAAGSTRWRSAGATLPTRMPRPWRRSGSPVRSVFSAALRPPGRAGAGPSRRPVPTLRRRLAHAPGRAIVATAIRDHP